nr:calcium-binding protein P-like [Paramormyrops kingsleyae]
MKLKIVTIISCLLSQCLAIPIVRLNGLTVSGIGFGQAQTTPFLPSFGLQPADLGFPPQLVPLNPQLAGPFMPQAPPVLLPAQTNQVPPGFLPPPQQEQPGLPLDATVAQQPQQGFNQMIPQYYPSFPYPQRPGGQGFPYYFSFGYPQWNPSFAQLQPSQPNGRQNLEQTTPIPNLLQGNTNRDFGTGSDITPSRRGDSVGTEVPNPSFVFEP